MVSVLLLAERRFFYHIAFAGQFQDTAQSMADSAGFHIQVIGRALQSRAQALTTFAVFTGSLWPFVSLPDFAIQGQNFLLETDTEMVAWAPLVIGDSNIRAWEAYSTYMLENSGWFPTIESEERLKTQLDRLEDQADQRAETEQAFESGLYVPLWQISPWFYNQWIMHNLTQQFEEPIELLLQTGQPVWSRFLDLDQPPNSGDAANQSSLPPTAAVSSLLFHPVFRSLAAHDVSYGTIKNFTVAQQEVVGIYIAAIQWDTFLARHVTEGTPGVEIVLQNPWGESLTYQVSSNGDTTMTTTSLSVASGDQHSSEYSEISQSTTLTGRLEPTTNNNQAEDALIARSSIMVRHPHTEKELVSAGYNISEDLMNNDGSSFQMTIYPKKSFEEAYQTTEPLVITIVLAALVFVAISVFFWYSQSVHNRQQKLVETANRTALVVKSLFPSNVRDRIMKEAEESDQKNKAKQKQAKDREAANEGSASSGLDRPAAGALTGGNSILGNISVGSVGSRGSRYGRRGSSRGSAKGNADPSQRNNSMGSDNPYGSKPIADHFSATTVLFADLVGFTAWSSVRERVAVFTLLETIYHAFDKVSAMVGVALIVKVPLIYTHSYFCPQRLPASGEFSR